MVWRIGCMVNVTQGGTNMIKSGKTAIATASVLLLGGLCAIPSRAENSGYLGLLRARDLTSFGFLRLDMRPAHAVAAEPGTWAIETELAYQNTWALSPEVENYLSGITQRHQLGPA